MGFITYNGESTPCNLVTTVDVDISIADLIDFVKVKNKNPSSSIIGFQNQIIWSRIFLLY